MEALASRRAPTQEEISARVLQEIAYIMNESCFADSELVQALQDGAAALRLEVVRSLYPPRKEA